MAIDSPSLLNLTRSVTIEDSNETFEETKNPRYTTDYPFALTMKKNLLTKCSCRKLNYNTIIIIPPRKSADKPKKQTKKTSSNLSPTIKEILQPTITLIDNNQDRFPLNTLQVISFLENTAGSNDSITLAQEYT
ncbi:hypothetical protein K0M31_001846 [Melipona bicolor]|uniref:Uncharacterized protein n=1 Tax=Melipona bicolor TaxID=60889 RepID=A0AA40GH48_9HYME|nr:hypothetical protein K0M31_001846 [Melipona bicolor]